MKIDIELGPVEMILMEKLNLKNLVERGASKPREIRVGQEILHVLDKDPYAELVDIGHFSAENVDPIHHREYTIP